jgi:hypothetical protein
MKEGVGGCQELLHTHESLQSDALVLALGTRQGDVVLLHFAAERSAIAQ